MRGSDYRLIFGTGLSSAKTKDGLLPVIQKALSSGVNAFDTAPSYKTETVLGECLNSVLSSGLAHRDEIWIQDKIDAWQMQECCGKVEEHVLASLKKMDAEYFDCMLIHWPLPEYRNATLQELFELKKSGILRSVGICNVKMRQLRELDEQGLLPDIVQLERNPLRTCEKETAFCHEKGIVLQSYSPLCKFCDEIKNSPILSELSQKYGKSIGQIVMRWHIETHSVPVFTTKNEARIDEYLEIFSFGLDKDDVQRISSMNKNYKMYLESVLCPGF